MSMPNESAPPTRDLPAEIEAAILDLCWFAVPYRADYDLKFTDVGTKLRHAIRSALDDQTRDYQASIDRLTTELDPFREQEQALRERCERLRFGIDSALKRFDEGIDGDMTADGMADDLRGLLQPGDLADNIWPRGEDER